MSHSRLLLKIYIGFLVALSGAIVVAASGHVEKWSEVLALAALVWVVGSWKSRLGERVLTSLSSVVSVTALFVAGAPGAIIAASANFIVLRRAYGLDKRLYNAAQSVIAVSVAGAIYTALRGGPVESVEGLSILELAGDALVSNVGFLVVNMVLLACVFWLDTGEQPLGVIRKHVVPTLVRLLGFGLLGVVMAVLWLGGLHWLAAIPMLLPFVVARWALGQYEVERRAQAATLSALAKVVENKDLYTRGHSERVSNGVTSIGKVMRFDQRRLTMLTNAGLLHDVGKVGVPTQVIRKSGSLSGEEFAAIRLHPARGVDLVGHIDFLQDAYDGILHHHERFDGSGYPAGLKGLDIPQFARIISVADAYDAMTTSRSYRAARSHEEALAEIVRSKRSDFDPEIVDAFVKALERFGWEIPATTEAVTPPKERILLDHDDFARLKVLPRPSPSDDVPRSSPSDDVPRSSGSGQPSDDVPRSSGSGQPSDDVPRSSPSDDVPRPAGSGQPSDGTV